MSDILLPPWLKFARVGIRYRDSTGVSEAEFTGYTRTGSRGGDRLKALLDFTPTGGRSAVPMMERRAVKAFLLSLEGRKNRPLLHDPAYVRAGVFPATELLANPTFENGTAGWTTGGNCSISVADRVLRAQYIASAQENFLIPTTVAVTQFAPYVARYMVQQGRGGFALGFRIDNTSEAGTASLGFGLKTQMFIAQSTSDNPNIQDLQTSGTIAGDYVLVPYASFSRCALVDNGPNEFTFSNEASNAAWGWSDVVVGTNNVTAPDGTITADNIVETTAPATAHFSARVTARASVAEDLCVYGFYRQDAGDRDIRLVVGSDGSNFGQAFFDLSAGTFGSVSNVGTATNARAFMHPYGGLWYFCAVIVRAAASATLRAEQILVRASDQASTYTGDGTSGIASFGVGAARTSVPTRGAQTTTAATTGTAPTGSAMYVKGLPASTAGLLLPSDQFEVITSRGSELKIVKAPLNSDAAGLGYLQFGPPLRGTVADNAPIIIHQPMGRFIFNGDMAGWDDEPGVITRAAAEFAEA